MSPQDYPYIPAINNPRDGEQWFVWSCPAGNILAIDQDPSMGKRGIARGSHVHPCSLCNEHHVIESAEIRSVRWFEPSAMISELLICRGNIHEPKGGIAARYDLSPAAFLEIPVGECLVDFARADMRSLQIGEPFFEVGEPRFCLLVVSIRDGSAMLPSGAYSVKWKPSEAFVWAKSKGLSSTVGAFSR